MAAGGTPTRPADAATPARIFISYRRADSAGFARAVADTLALAFGEQRVFIDVDDIDAGQPFADVISQTMVGSSVLLVVIGPGWLATDAAGARRLDDPADLVRQEVIRGLAAGLRVVPLLVDGAAMPAAEQLPEVLRALAGRNAVDVRHAHFSSDMQRLVASLRQGFAEPAALPSQPGPTTRPRAWTPAHLAMAGGVVLTLVGAWGWWATPAERVAINGRWAAQLRYDWPNADYEERFEFSGQGRQLSGTASFLRVPRGVQQGQVQADHISFVTRSGEMTGDGQPERTLEHRYEGRLVGDRLELLMVTSGGSGSAAPVKVVAHRAVAPR